MDIKNEVLYRIYGLLFGIIVPVSIVLLYRTVQIGVAEGAYWRDKGKERYIKPRTVEGERGNIMATDGSLLATSIPFFDIYFDPLAPSEDDYMYNVDTLAQALADFVQAHTAGKYREILLEWREGKERYIPIVRDISYAQKQRMAQFPLFNLGRYRGGFIAQKKSKRKRPFGLLARRTVGYTRGSYQVGLEGQFNDILDGEPGQQLMIRVDKSDDLWLPLEDLTQIEPQNGYDIKTTIDINLQDITETALMRAMQAHVADWGTAIVMEVKTGAIRAIANLGKEGEIGYEERYNHAIASDTEPGSTFKIASIMALLEDGYVTLDDSVDIEKGTTQFYEEVMEDSNPLSKSIDSTTVQRAFEISSNVGIAKLVNKFYSKKTKLNQEEGAARFIRRLKQFSLDIPTGIEIEGEQGPYIKEAYSEADLWSGTSLPWMATGYELQITPLQLLTFYNAIANDGTIMKPYLVEEIQEFGHTIDHFLPTVVKKQMATPSTIQAAQILLEGVVENGTASKLKTDAYRFAGKTGTAQINYQRLSGYTRVGGYQASFAGYFPAKNPIYSCIVVIYNPTQNGFYGGDVAGPVFREIADKAYGLELDLHRPLNFIPKPKLINNWMPHMNIGAQEDFKSVLNQLNIPYFGLAGTEFGVLAAEGDTLKILPRENVIGVVPNVVGLGLRDALYLLENEGLQVEVNGFGRVVRQSIGSGTKAQGQTIIITLDQL